MQHSNEKHMEAETLNSYVCWLTIATTCFSKEIKGSPVDGLAKIRAESGRGKPNIQENKLVVRLFLIKELETLVSYFQ